MLSDLSEHRCQTLAISVTGAQLRAPVHGRVGEPVVCYLDRFGRLEGTIGRLFDDGFSVDFKASVSKRQRLAVELARPSPASAPDAAHQRVQPIRCRVVLRIAHGPQVAVKILEITRLGATLTCPLPLAVGQLVTLGQHAATVERCVQRLVTVGFALPIDLERFDADFQV